MSDRRGNGATRTVALVRKQASGSVEWKGSKDGLQQQQQQRQKKKVKCDMTSVSLAVNACHLDEQEENDDDLLLAVFEGKCGKEGVTQCSQANRCAPVSC